MRLNLFILEDGIMGTRNCFINIHFLSRQVFLENQRSRVTRTLRVGYSLAKSFHSSVEQT